MMKELRITLIKADSEKPEVSFKIPIDALKIVDSLIPGKIKDKMSDEGVTLKEIANASENSDVTGKLMEINRDDWTLVFEIIVPE